MPGFQQNIISHTKKQEKTKVCKDKHTAKKEFRCDIHIGIPENLKQ